MITRTGGVCVCWSIGVCLFTYDQDDGIYLIGKGEGGTRTVTPGYIMLAWLHLHFSEGPNGPHFKVTDA